MICLWSSLRSLIIDNVIRICNKRILQLIYQENLQTGWSLTKNKTQTTKTAYSRLPWLLVGKAVYDWWHTEHTELQYDTESYLELIQGKCWWYETSSLQAVTELNKKKMINQVAIDLYSFALKFRIIRITLYDNVLYLYSSVAISSTAGKNENRHRLSS